jgi:transposase
MRNTSAKVEVQKEFEKLIMQGKTQKEACQIVGVSEQTGVLWVRSIPSLRIKRVIEPLYKWLDANRNDLTLEGLERKREIIDLINTLTQLSSNKNKERV